MSAPSETGEGSASSGPTPASSSLGVTLQSSSTPSSAAGSLLNITELVYQCHTEFAKLLHRGILRPEDSERIKISFSSQTTSCYVCACLVSVCKRLESKGESGWKLAFKPSALILLMPNFDAEQKFAHSELMLISLTACLPMWTLRLHSATLYAQINTFFQTVQSPVANEKPILYGLVFANSDIATEFSSRLTARIIEMSEFDSTSLKERRKTVKERSHRSKSLRRMISRSKSSSSSGFSEISRPCVCQRLASATAQECENFAEILDFAELRMEAAETSSGVATTASANANTN